MLRYRIISIVTVAVLLLSVTSFFAARSSQQFQLRGGTADFPPPVHGAEALRLGVNASLEQYDPSTLDLRLADLASRGVRYVRQEFRWTDIEASRGLPDWTTADHIFAAARKHDIEILPVLVTTPPWARASTGSSETPPIETMPPANAADFGTFAGEFARRYETTTGDGSPAILAYQVWDEPNLSAQWGNSLINPTGYLKMLRAAKAAVHAVNPSAVIVLAGLAPTVEQTDVNLAPHLYLRKLYDAGGRDAFDIVATKPYGFDSPPEDRRVDPGVLNFSRAILVREEMIAHGDAQKAIWLTQWGWNAQLPGWQGQNSIWSGVSEAEQAAYTAQAVQRVAREWYWAGAMFLYTLQPNADETDARWGFSLLDQQGRPRIVYDAYTSALTAASAAPRAQLASEEPGIQPIRPAGVGVSSTVTATSHVPNPLATFSEGWRFSELGADIPQRDDAGVTLRFSGDALAMMVRRDDYRAYMFINIDGRPANLLPSEARGAYLILTSPDRLPHVDSILVADRLGPGQHVAEVRIDRGWNQWALVGWSSRDAVSSSVTLAAAAMPVSVALLFLSLLGLALSFSSARWQDVRPRAIRGTERLTWQAVAAALLLWITSSLTWGEDAATAYRNLGTPAHVVLAGLVSALAFWSPIFVLSLLALAALFVLVLLQPDVGLALLAFFIPFYLIPQHIFAKTFPMVELLLFMCTVSWAVRKISRWSAGTVTGQGRLNLYGSIQALAARITLLDWSIFALAVVAALSASQADFKVEAFRELRMVVVEPAVLFLVLRTLRLDEEQIWRITDGFVLGAVAIAVIGLVNYARGNVFPAEFGLARIRSVYGSPNNDALYLGRAFPVLLAMVLFAVRLGTAATPRMISGLRIPNVLFDRRVFYGAGLILVAIALGLSESRGALLLGVPSAVVAVCVLGGGRWRYLGSALWALAVVALVVLLSGVAEPFLTGTRFANALDLTSGTGFFRINLWQSALRMWLDHPLLGVGPDNFLYAYRGFYILPAAWQEPNLSHPHDIMLDFATRLGLLGVLVGAGLALGISQMARSALKLIAREPQAARLRPLAIGLVGLFVYVVAHGLVDNALFLVDLAFVFMLACGLLAQVGSYGETIKAQTLTKL